MLVTHESFVLPKKVIRQFEDESGYDLVVRAAGDAGTLTNKLVLTKEDPTGDVAFGVDNTFASRALEEGVFAPYSFDQPAGVDDYDLPGDDGHALTPVDNGNVCVNVDDTWFAERDLAPPATLDDLTDPAYQDLFVLPGAATSSPGMAFLLATIAEYGDAWPGYWEDLMANGALLTSSWSDAYEVDFTQGGGKGDRPIVLSYDSSPAFTVPEGSDTSTTSALLDTCFRQVEYAGVLRGAKNVAGRRGVRAVPRRSAGAGRAAREHVRLPGRRRHRAARRVGVVRQAAERAVRRRPRRGRREPRRLAARVERHLPVTAMIRSSRRSTMPPGGGRPRRSGCPPRPLRRRLRPLGGRAALSGGRACRDHSRSPASPWCRSSCWASSSCSR